ncbi:ABC transporter substrate-binding protein [Fusobacterium necrophorum]|uniref:ABC transporter substrate-binding protein n=1 Tax=Fusobacterium necrophorum TaxID=859 RepID=UPI00254D0E2C|nr:ABC transporter substrate-binding protein [Fusobacterium necrophorum]MDK4501315.1 ABC transporter substrate-binding protein [Fusobacterium necrophorum]
MYLKNFIKKIYLIFLVVSMSIILMACGEESSKETLKKKDELVIAVGSLFDSGQFNPKQKYGSHQQHRLTHSSLLKYDPDLNLIGDLAASYEIAEDGLSWTFAIKPDVKFSNGETVTVDDVLFTYNMLKEDGIAFDLTFLDRMEVIENNKVKFFLKEPRITFVSQLTEIPIVPAKYYNENYTHNPIGSGPYMVKEYKKGEQVIFEENPYYNKPLSFKKLTFLLLEEDAALAAAKAGGIDVLAIPASFSEQKIENMTLQSYPSVDARGICFPTLPAGNKGLVNGIEVNVGNNVTSDLAIRQALNIGLNRKELIALTMNGYGKVSYSLSDGLPWFNEEQIIKDGNIEEAKHILSNAGWKDEDGDGILEKNGIRASFELYYSAEDKLRGDLSIGVADQAAKFGIEIKPRGSSWDEIFRNGKENAIMWAGGRHHPHQLYTMYSSKVIDTGYNNMSQYKNELVDNYLNKAMTSSDVNSSYQYWKLAQWDSNLKKGFAGIGDAPIVWLTRIDHLYFVRNDLDIGKQILHSHGYEWSLFNDIDTWKLK